MIKPLVYDLCCGRGGWARGFLAEGYIVIGFDVDDQPDYPGVFYRADVRGLIGHKWHDAAVIVASPPCQEFTRHQLPWTKRHNPPEPDLSIVQACRRIAAEAGVPLVMENVRNAQRWLGKAKAHYGSRYLWGDVPPILPFAEKSRKEHLSSTAVALRSEIPFDLARFIAQCFKPAREATA